MPKIIRSLKDLKNLPIDKLENRRDPEALLVCEPKYFDVIDVKNPHMKGKIGLVDRKLARMQWDGMVETFKKLKSTVHFLPPTEKLEDMVFTANPVLPGQSVKGDKLVLLSNMRHPSRQKEVAAYEKWFAENGYQVHKLSNPKWNFEGQGDALWHPGKRLLWGGYGFRTDPEVYEEISQLFETPIILLELLKDHFYHLDTCLCPISSKAALYYPGAFSPEGLAVLKAVFTDLIEVSEKEAKEGFACNGLSLGRYFVIHKGNPKTCQEIKKRGFEPVEIDTSEFMKSGGSVFCMKMMVY